MMLGKKNMCRLDQVVRLVVAGLSFYLGIINPGIIDNQMVNGLLVFFGAVNVYAGIAAWCPVYALANLSTLRKA